MENVLLWTEREGEDTLEAESDPVDADVDIPAIEPMHLQGLKFLENNQMRLSYTFITLHGLKESAACESAVKMLIDVTLQGMTLRCVHRLPTLA